MCFKLRYMYTVHNCHTFLLATIATPIDSAYIQYILAICFLLMLMHAHNYGLVCQLVKIVKFNVLHNVHIAILFGYTAIR